MTKFLQNNLLLSSFSGLLLVLSFPITPGIFLLGFVSWIPLLLMEHNLSGRNRSGWKVFGFAYLCFFIYNLGTTWWIYYASPGGAYMAFFANTLLMAIAFTIYHLINKFLFRKWWQVSFICVWLTFELLHFHWDLSWPWLTLGNIFASAHYLVQWYSITGVFGGSLWLIIINVLIVQLILNQGQNKKTDFVLLSSILVLPILISTFMYFNKDTKGTPFNVTVLQPNLDPYNEKFTGDNSTQLHDLLALAEQVNKKNTKLIVAPETALYPNIQSSNDYLVVDRLPYHEATRTIKAYQKNRKIPFLIGGSTYDFFEKERSAASNYNPSLGLFEESYNSSLFFDINKNPQVIHKSKLVLGVEKIPFISSLPFLKTMAIDLGGSSGSLGIADHPSVFAMNKLHFAPVVCYESIYGEFVSEQCAQKSNFIAIITNDGWWRDTPGYKQHFLFAKLRAIENNQWVVRSANTGKSGIFNNRGDVVVETGWWQKKAINETIQLKNESTVYQMFGDFIPRIASGLLIALLCKALYNRFRKKS